MTPNKTKKSKPQKPDGAARPLNPSNPTPRPKKGGRFVVGDNGELQEDHDAV